MARSFIGMGSLSAAPFMYKAMRDLKKADLSLLSLDYRGVGNDKGLSQLQAGLADFAISDGVPNAEDALLVQFTNDPVPLFLVLKKKYSDCAKAEGLFKIAQYVLTAAQQILPMFQLVPVSKEMAQQGINQVKKMLTLEFDVYDETDSGGAIPQS